MFFEDIESVEVVEEVAEECSEEESCEESDSTVE